MEVLDEGIGLVADFRPQRLRPNRNIASFYCLTAFRPLKPDHQTEQQFAREGETIHLYGEIVGGCNLVGKWCWNLGWNLLKHLGQSSSKAANAGCWAGEIAFPETGAGVAGAGEAAVGAARARAVGAAACTLHSRCHQRARMLQAQIREHQLAGIRDPHKKYEYI